MDRTDLLTVKLSSNEFIELLCEKLNKITSHSFIAKSQAKYLKHLKEILSPDQAIVLGDFAENYTFVVQDEIQNYHLCKKQCSIHPIIIYYMKEQLEESSFCVISDNLNHDVEFVSQVIHQIIDHIKTNLCPSITKWELADRFSIATTVPGTRSFHQIVPLSKPIVSMKWVSDDDGFAIQFDFLNKKKNYKCIQIENVKISQYLLCRYDELYWIGMVSEIDSVNDDFKIKFMHPNVPSRFYNRPNRDDVCWEPRLNVISIIEAPSLSSLSKQQYHISKEDNLLIEKLLSP